MRHIGVLMHSPSNEPDAQARLAAIVHRTCPLSEQSDIGRSHPNSTSVLA